MKIRLKLPYPPSANTYWRSAMTRHSDPDKRRAITYISQKGQAYRDEVAYIVYEAGLQSLNLSGRLAVFICHHRKDKRSYDIDNYEKCLLDSLTKSGLWLDDKQIDMLMITRGEVDKLNPRSEILIIEIPEGKWNLLLQSLRQFVSGVLSLLGR